jgi:hypothetical protein
MSKFFDSDIIQEELEEIENLQEFIYNNILNFGMMNRENKLKHIDKMTELLEKQRIMYVRLSLSDDEEAIEMKENLQKSFSLMGFPLEIDMNTFFTNMEKTIESLKQYLDN